MRPAGPIRSALCSLLVVFCVSAATAQTPAHEAYLRQAIDALRSDPVNLSLFSLRLQVVIEAHRANDKASLANFGAIRSIEYRGVEGRQYVSWLALEPGYDVFQIA